MISDRVFHLLLSFANIPLNLFVLFSPPIVHFPLPQIVPPKPTFSIFISFLPFFLKMSFFFALFSFAFFFQFASPLSSSSFDNRQLNVSPLRNVRAHYDAKKDKILVDWEWSEVERKEVEDYKLFVRYKVSTEQRDGGAERWHRMASDEDALGAKIPLGQMLNNGDEITVQVIAEPNEKGFATEQSDPLIIWIARRTDRGNESGENSEQKRTENAETGDIPLEDELLPPHNFTASVLSPGQVRLEWRPPPLPSPSSVPFYIVNVRQLSANSGDRFAPQQLRVDGTNFLLGNLVAGENFEFTIRTALDAERISSAAAIVEMAIPSNSDLVEVGKLIVTSRFHSDGHGVVNLTWEVPQNLLGKIQSYEMRYLEAERAKLVAETFWEKLFFLGTAPTAELYNLKPDTEYVLRIRTTMASRVQVESGEFRFRTPKSNGANPIARLDVLYSSETPAVRLQWILAPHINIALVGGYDLFISDRYDLPESEWTHRRINGKEPQLPLDSLSPSTTYFVRIDVRYSDGTVMKSQAPYRFTTFETLPLRRDFRQIDTLAYQQIGPGHAQIHWKFPEAIKMGSKGITVFYNSDTREPLDRWHRIDLDSSEPRSIELVGLRDNTEYHVQIVPISRDGRPMWTNTQRIQLRTKVEEEGEDEEEEEEESPMGKRKKRGGRRK